MKTLHIKVDTLGDHTAQGWWIDNGRPKVEKYVVIEAQSAYNPAIDEAVEFLHKMGARQIHILPCTILKSFREA